MNEQPVLADEREADEQPEVEAVEAVEHAWSVSASGVTTDDNAAAVLQADMKELFTRHAQQNRVDDFDFTSEAENVDDLTIDDIVPPDNVVPLGGDEDEGDGGTDPEPDPGPHIDSVAPPALVAEESTDLTVSGSGFVDGSTIEIDGGATETAFVSESEVSTLGYSAPTDASGVEVTVRNPDDAESNSFNVPVE